MEDPNRLDAIEFKLAHLEQALNEINDVVIRQQRQLEAAVARQQRLLQQLESLESQQPGGGQVYEKPPHY
ncbi:MAG: SlyX family protein [Steroidobacteraceae bacterium]